MLGYHRYRKTGIFAIYCVALMIQDNQAACLENLLPIFTNETILKEMQHSIKDVEVKFQRFKNKDSSHQGKAATKSSEQVEYEEALNMRTSCLQIIVILIEFLSNSIIKNGYVVIENVQTSMPNSPYKKV
jgi:hypothetical protein